MERRQSVSVIRELGLSTLINGMSAVSGGSADYTAEAYQLNAKEEAVGALARVRALLASAVSVNQRHDPICS